MNQDLKQLLAGRPWPFSSNEGVGLHLKGQPPAEARRVFAEALLPFGCHRNAGDRIYLRLMASGSDRLTVQDGLPLLQVKEALLKFGIEMSVIDPQPDWRPRFNDGPWDKRDLDIARGAD